MANPLYNIIGTQMISPIIQKIQFSIFRFAISHIPTKNRDVVKMSNQLAQSRW